MDDFLEKKPKKHSDAALATAARFSWASDISHGISKGLVRFIENFVSLLVLVMCFTSFLTNTIGWAWSPMPPVVEKQRSECSKCSYFMSIWMTLICMVVLFHFYPRGQHTFLLGFQKHCWSELRPGVRPVHRRILNASSMGE